MILIGLDTPIVFLMINFSWVKFISKFGIVSNAIFAGSCV